MDYFTIIYDYIVANFFYDIRSSIISISFILLLLCVKRLGKDKCDKISVTIKYLVETAMCFGTLIIFI